MSKTVGHILTQGAWVEVANGDGTATVTTEISGCRWAITDTAAPPAFTGGHVCPFREDLSMSLATGERLWLRGVGAAYVTAEVPVP